ncbi:MAG: hypothetical protein QMD17_08830 [Rhodocyclaceae bacterium]|nr:hypothetical protein [Rhodocyclaceae bacterium]
MLLARIYEAFQLACPICHGEMRIIAFINAAGTVKKILDHIGEATQPPRFAPARGPPLGCGQSLVLRSSSISASKDYKRCQRYATDGFLADSDISSCNIGD